MPHIPPRYRGHIDGFKKVTKCPRCMTVGQYEDAHPADCCRYCGERPVTQAEGRVWFKSKRRWLTFDEMLAIEEEERASRMAKKPESLLVSLLKFIVGRGDL